MAKKSTPAPAKKAPKKEAKAVKNAPKKEAKSPKVEKEKKSKKVVEEVPPHVFTMESNEATTPVASESVNNSSESAPVAPEFVKGSNEELLETFMNGSETGTISWYEMQNLGMDMNTIGFIEAKISKYKLRRPSPAHSYEVIIED